MKKTVIITVILILSACEKKPDFVTVNDICASKPSLPIESKKDAICYALLLDNVEGNMRSAQNEHGSYIKGWKAEAKNQPLGIWQIKIHSTGQLPSYACSVSFDKSGNITQQPECHYNK